MAVLEEERRLSRGADGEACKIVLGLQLYLQSKYELIGNSIDEVLDAVNALKFHYGKDCVIVEDESGHDSVNKIGGYITFDDSIKLRSGGVDPKSNIVREMNYILEEEMKNVKLYKVDTY